MKVTIYHNPRCSKSRQTLALLQERDLDLQIIEYLKTPPDRQQIDRILDMLGIQPRELMRQGEPEYHTLGIDDPRLSRESLIDAMVDHPRLMQRPIVLVGDKAAIGRPPEAVLNIL